MISLLRRIARSRRTILGAAAIAAMIVLAPTGAAVAADTLPVSAPVAAGSIVETGYVIPDDGGPSESEIDERTKNYVSSTTLRTLNRWGDSANSFHTKFDGFIGTQLADMAERNMFQGGWMKFGNWAMSVTSEFTQFAVNLDIINGIGAAVDNIVKVMLNALIGVTGGPGAGVLFGVVALLAVLMAIWRNYRGGIARMMREVGAIVVVVAVVFGIGMTALNYNPGKGDTYNPAPASPGWFVKGVNDGISNLTALPAKSFVDGVDSSGWGSNLSASTLGGGLGCAKYTSAMSAMFNSGVSATTTSSKSQMAIAQVTDSLWDSTGLYVWAMTQAGYNNPYAAKVYCRILDFRNNTAPGSDAYVTYVAALNGGYGASATSLSNAIRTDASLRAPFAPSSVDNTMASIVAWAACKPTGFANGRFSWAWESGWEGFSGGYETVTNPRGFEMTSSNANSECQKWWEAATPTDASGDATGGQDVPDIFDVKGDAGWISDRTANANANVRDFLFAVTGINPWGGTTGVISYAGGAFMTMAAFIFIDVIVIIAKLFAAMFILSLWFVLIGAMFRPSEMKDRLGKTVNKFLGTAVFASLATLILTFVIVFTRALISMGIQIWGAGSMGSMLWSGAAPVLALVLVHIMFTKVFKLPSPVSLRGAQAWGKSGMSGALGAGVGAGVGSYMGTRAGALGKSVGKSIGNAALSKVSGGRLGGASGTRSAMAPAGKKPGLSEELASRVEAGEQLTRKEQKVVGKEAAAAEAAKTQREWQLAAEQEQAQKKTDRADLRSARREYREEFGVAAPGDLAGAIALGATGLAATAGAKARAAGTTISDKTGLTALRSELGARRDARRQTVAARKADAATRSALRGGIADKAAASVAGASSAASAVMGGADSAAKRAAWGVTGAAASAAAAAPGIASTASNGSTAAQTVSMMGGAGGGAALAGAISGGLVTGRRGVAGGRAMTANAPRAEVITNPNAPAAITDVVAPQVEATPVVERRDAIIAPTGAPQRRIVAGPVARVNVPAGSTIGDVRTLGAQRGAVVGQADVKVGQARIQQGGKPATVTGGGQGVARGGSAAQISGAVTPAVGRVAKVLSAPAAAAHAARQAGWKAQDATASKATQVVNSKAVKSAVNDARIARAAVGMGADAAKSTAAYRGAEKAAQKTAQTIAKGAGVAAAGARAVGARKSNNAAVLAGFRERKNAEAQALRAAEEATKSAAAHVKGKGDTPGDGTTKGKSA
ncbi:MAG: hypothetical protein J0J04_04850 [Microbacterium sp.]|uniref:hypothetical protein n=1 Tax=Microbacterium sp. TaxID=51671 RepID=UPI001ACCA6A8|nr:hypothetical protein [Microbacterium sp.]MBN9214137.1 hypothetical protein [Microbacterium sp.]